MAVNPEFAAELRSLCARYPLDVLDTLVDTLVALVGVRAVERELSITPKKKRGRPLSVAESELCELGKVVAAGRARKARYPDATSMLGALPPERRHAKATALVRNFNKNPDAYLPKPPPLDLWSPETKTQLAAAGRNVQACIEALRDAADTWRGLAEQMRRRSPRWAQRPAGSR
jgi:hypothetical protein